MTIKVNSRGFLTPYFMKTTYLYCLPTFIIFWPPLPPNIHCKIPSSTLFIALIFWLNGQSQHIWCVILLNDIMALHLPSLCYHSITRTLWCVLCNKGSVYYNTWHVFLLVLWFDTTHTKKRKTHSTHWNQQTDTLI